MLLHEFGHIFTARAFGISTPDVTLLPIGGVARLERIPEQPRQEFLIAIAGPLVNVVIAGLLVLVAGADLQITHLASLDSTSTSLVDRLAVVNLFLALFNLIPAFPMDGGRVLRALLASKLGYVHATEIAATIGQWVAFALGFLGLFGNPLLIFIAVFVYLAAASEAHLVAIRAMSRGVPVTAAMMTQFATLTPDEHVDAAVETLLRTSQGEFPVVDGNGRPLGVLGRNDLIRALKERGPNARVADAMTGRIPTVEPKRLPGRRIPAAPGEIRAGRSGRRRHGQAGRPCDIGDGRRNADAAPRHAGRRTVRAVEPPRRRDQVVR